MENVYFTQKLQTTTKVRKATETWKARGSQLQLCCWPLQVLQMATLKRSGTKTIGFNID